jgi:hypothetical protein
MIKAVLSILTLWVIILPLSSHASYVMKDLQVLAKQKSFVEFFQHALDIVPSKRDTTWTNTVGQMAEQFSEQMVKSPILNVKNYQLLLEISTWPALQANDLVKINRDQLNIRYSRQCFNSSLFNKCQKELNKYVYQFNPSKETRFELLKIYYPKLDEATAKVDNTLNNLIKPLITTGFSEFYCGKDPLAEIVDFKLKISVNQLGSKTPLTTIVHKDCLKPLISKYQKQLNSSANIFEKELAYLILNESGAISALDKQTFHMLFILQNARPGEIFNHAWNSLEKLSRDFKMRDKVLAKLKSLDPLPGKVFAKRNSQREQLIVKHFTRHFPEYIDYYARQCIKFYKSEGEFPRGNPTIECRDFMRTATNLSLLPKSMINDFNRASQL